MTKPCIPYDDWLIQRFRKDPEEASLYLQARLKIFKSMAMWNYLC